MKNFTYYFTRLLSNPKIPIGLKNYYLSNPRFFNYILICGIGVLINQVILHFLAQIMFLWIANFMSITIAFLWNYVNALGSFAKYWGMDD